jgi:putative membrane-bound dehydrogenase-like protein
MQLGKVALCGTLLVGFAVGWAGAEPRQADSLDRDYSADLPRIAPTEPKEALATFTVAPGFRLEQVTAEPLVADPIALAFDENGRLYVVEMRGYSENRDENLSRIRLLEDSDGDGRFEKSTIFAEGLAWPTAIHCWQGGVLVADAPDILYFKDTTGDNKADERKVLFTGFSRSNVQGLLNSFTWGLDNRIYGATSSSGGQVTPVDDIPRPPTLLRGRDFAIEPRGMTMVPVSGGAQHGLSINNWGERFVSSNSDHIQQVMYEDRYLGRNPYLAAPPPRRSIAADGPQADVFRTSPIEPWRIIRTRLRMQKIVPGIVEGGGRAAGYFTGATGATIYRGDAWPAEWQGLAIVGDVGSNLVHRKRLTQQGIGYVATRIDEKSEFVASSDNWFRPVQFANAPDGTLYICDMYREVIEHPASIPPLLKQHLDLTSGRDRGRIYRVVPAGYQQRPLPKLGTASVGELVATLAHPNGWHRDTAARLLYERQDRSAAPLLEKLAREAKLPETRNVACYSLDGHDAHSSDDL